MPHRHIALGVASTGIALAFVVLVKLFRSGKKKTKSDGNAVLSSKAASRQGTRSPTGQARSGKTRRVQPHQRASAGPATAAVAQAGSGQHGAIKRRVKPRSPKPATAESASGAAQRPSSRSQNPVAPAAGAASLNRAAAGQEAASVPKAPTAPGAAGQKPVAEQTDVMACSRTSSPGTETSPPVSVLQEASVPSASPLAKQDTDAGAPKGIVAAIAAEVQSSETANSALMPGASSAATGVVAQPAMTLALAETNNVNNCATPAAALVEVKTPAIPEAKAAPAVSLTLPESEPAAASASLNANVAQPVGAAGAAAAVVTMEPSESLPAQTEAVQPPALPAADQSSQETEASAAVSPAGSLPVQANAAGAEPLTSGPAVEAADTPSKQAAASDTPARSAAAAASAPAKTGGSRPSRVTMSPAVEAAEEEQRSKSKQRLTVADIIRESIKLKQKNERLKQQLSLKSERHGRANGSGSSSSSRSTGASISRSSSAVPASHEAAPITAGAAATDTPSKQGQDQAGNQRTAAVAAAAEKPVPAATAPEVAAEVSSSQPENQQAAGDANGAAGGSISDVPSSSRGTGASSSGSGRRSERERESRVLSLSPADLMREMSGIKAENMELVKLLAAQLAEVRQQNAELMAAFHRREQLAAVREEGEGERSSKGTGQAGADMAATDGGSTPNTGSELGTFKDRLRLPGFGRAPGSAAGSDAGSSLRSAPAGVGGSTPSRGLWKWASGGRRTSGAMTADNVSLPDSMASPRSNISVPVETLVDLLDWAAR